MCNSANHSPRCTCGFGGQGHLGRRTEGAGVYKNKSQITSLPHHSYDTFVNPNAHCPVCGIPVFFYQSESGSRVFFDELGPPWSKHTCTDNQQLKTPNKLIKRNSPLKQDASTSEITLFHWQQIGWEPFLSQEMHTVHNSFLAITGIYKSKITTVYLQINLVFSKNTPIQLKTIDNHSFEMSTFIIENGNHVIEEMYTVYISLQAAHISSIRKKESIRNNKNKVYISNKNIKARTSLKGKEKKLAEKNTSFVKKVKVKVKPKTAMELAFEKARNH